MRINPLHRQSPSLSSIPFDDAAPEEAYLAKLVEYTRMIFLNKKGIPPVFIYEKNGDIHTIKVPSSLIDDEEGKDALALMIGQAVETFKPNSHCFVSESWMYKMDDFDTKEEAMAAFVAFKKGVPNTKIAKIEVVTLAFTRINPDNSQTRWMGTMPFSRDADDKISSFEPMKWIKSEGEAKLTGRLFG
jgi:hypothetical protein